MSRRRRWLLGTTVVLVACVLVVWSIIAPGARPEVKLVFIGYTNSPMIYIGIGSGSVTSTILYGWFMVTNTGSVPAKLFPDIRFDSNTETSNFALPLFGLHTGSLRPGEAVLLRVMAWDDRHPWYTELAYCRHGLGTQMNDALAKRGRAVVQAVLKRLSPLPDKQWAQSGWITNMPPAAP